MNRYKTPLRYPGGKQKLAPFIREVLRANGLTGTHYVEPYAGGAGIAIDLLLGGDASRIYLNDSCRRVYAFWKSVLNKTEDFCRKISRASLTVDEWKKQKQIFLRPREHDQFDLGFSTFFLNRCNRSGILSGGMIGGIAQRGEWKLDARFPRNELIRRIEAIGARSADIRVKNLDAEEFLVNVVNELPINSLVYLDPPYFGMGGRLYLNSYREADHRKLARVFQKTLNRPWIVTYDSAPEITRSYSKRRGFSYGLAYSAARAYSGREVIYFSDDLVIPTETKVEWLVDPLRRAHNALGTRAMNGKLNARKSGSLRRGRV